MNGNPKITFLVVSVFFSTNNSNIQKSYARATLNYPPHPSLPRVTFHLCLVLLLLLSLVLILQSLL
jgi:Na+/H+ antiporter NhaD/arsenite permease-like protein